MTLKRDLSEMTSYYTFHHYLLDLSYISDIQIIPTTMLSSMQQNSVYNFNQTWHQETALFRRLSLQAVQETLDQVFDGLILSQLLFITSGLLIFFA